MTMTLQSPPPAKPTDLPTSPDVALSTAPTVLVEITEAYQTHYQAFERTAARIVGPEHAADVVEDAIDAALAKLDTFQPGTNARAWLMAFVVNYACNQLRRQRAEDLHLKYPGVPLAAVARLSECPVCRTEGVQPREACPNCGTGIPKTIGLDQDTQDELAEEASAELEELDTSQWVRMMPGGVETVEGVTLEVLGTLSPPFQEAFERTLAGESQVAIAQDLGWSRATLQRRLQEVRALIRARLQEFAPELFLFGDGGERDE